MGQLFRLLRAALRKGNKQLLSDWFNARQPIEIPTISSTQHFKACDFQSRLADFNALHHWQHAHLHPCFSQFLGLAQHINALSDRQSPFPLMGLVQINNQIVCNVPLQNDDMTIDCHFSAIEPHPHGITVEVNIDVTQFGQTSVCASSTYLYRMSPDEVADKKTSLRQALDTPAMTPLPDDSMYRLEENAGRKYARISGDYNPIHFYDWSARLFGFKSSIAHGMHVLALALSNLENQYAILGKAPVTVTNQFLYPATLPCTFAMKSSQVSLDPHQPLAFEVSNPSASRRKQLLLTGTIERHTD